MAASFSSLWGAPHVICDQDQSVLVDGLWMYDRPKGTTRLSCGLYRSAAGDLILKVWRNSKFYRSWQADEATLCAETDANRRLLEADGWEAL